MSANDRPMRQTLVTGATGSLGSHICEHLRKRGVAVRALCRPGSDAKFLAALGVEPVVGDVTDESSVRAACQGVDTMFHAAARVGDWGPWDDFVRVTVEGTQSALNAAASARVDRFVHVSSSSVYGHLGRHVRVIDETTPVGTHIGRWNYYARSKLEAERRVWAMHSSGRVVATVVRPAWLYGPRDRASMPRLIDSLRRGRLRLIGPGDNRLSLVHASNVAEAVVLAGGSRRAAGEVYNCSHDGSITQRAYFDMIADAAGLPRVAASVPYRIAHAAAFAMECSGRLFRRRMPPLVTRHIVWLMGRRCLFECQKIKEELGWQSAIPYELGVPAAARACAASIGQGQGASCPQAPAQRGSSHLA